jgi:hypothetical protein
MKMILLIRTVDLINYPSWNKNLDGEVNFEYLLLLLLKKN